MFKAISARGQSLFMNKPDGFFEWSKRDPNTQAGMVTEMFRQGEVRIVRGTEPASKAAKIYLGSLRKRGMLPLLGGENNPSGKADVSGDENVGQALAGAVDSEQEDQDEEEEIAEDEEQGEGSAVNRYSETKEGEDSVIDHYSEVEILSDSRKKTKKRKPTRRLSKAPHRKRRRRSGMRCWQFTKRVYKPTPNVGRSLRETS